MLSRFASAHLQLRHRQEALHYLSEAFERGFDDAGAMCLDARVRVSGLLFLNPDLTHRRRRQLAFVADALPALAESYARRRKPTAGASLSTTTTATTTSVADDEDDEIKLRIIN